MLADVVIPEVQASRKADYEIAPLLRDRALQESPDH